MNIKKINKREGKQINETSFSLRDVDEFFYEYNDTIVYSGTSLKIK